MIGFINILVPMWCGSNFKREMFEPVGCILGIARCPYVHAAGRHRYSIIGSVNGLVPIGTRGSDSI